MVAAIDHELLTPEEEEIPAVIRILVLEELSKGDLAFLQYMARRRRVELDECCRPMDPQAPPIDAFALMWLEARGLIDGETDPGGRLWISMTKSGDAVLRPEKTKRRRRG